MNYRTILIAAVFHFVNQVETASLKRYVITKFSQMDSLPNFLTHGAPLCARFARARSSAIILYSEMITGSLTLYNVNKLAKKNCPFCSQGLKQRPNLAINY